MMLDNVSAAVTLHNGVKMPWLGLGTWQSPDGDAEKAIQWALQAGYRHIDTASVYGNEVGVGAGVRASGLRREELFITTKVWNEDQRKGTDAVMRAFEDSLKRLKMDYVDLYLVHWPVKGRYKDTWRVMEKIYASGRAKAIGVSNFLVHHLQDLLADAKVVPMVNQVEFHPLLRQQELLDFCVAHKIQHEAWSPLMQGKAGNVAELKAIGGKYGKSPEQITLRWEMQKGSIVIPKSIKRERIIANAAIFDFALTDQEMRQIDALDRNQRFGSHPETFTF
jgi:diketogulonate reductase-like aldo/keto reductase